MDTGVVIFDYADVVKKAVDKYDKNATQSFSDGISGQIDRNMAISNWINNALFGNPARTSGTKSTNNPAPASQPPAAPVIKATGELIKFDGEKMLDAIAFDETRSDRIEELEKVSGNGKPGLKFTKDINDLNITIVTKVSNGDIHVSMFSVNNKNDDGSDKFDADHIKEFEEKVNEVVNLKNNETVVIDGYGDASLKITKTTKNGFPSLEFAVEKKPAISIGNTEANAGNGEIIFLKGEIEAIKNEINGADGFKNPYGNKARSKRKFIEDVLNFIRSIEKLVNTTIEIPSEIREYIKNIDDETASSILDNINKNEIKKFVNELFNSKDSINCTIVAF